MEVFYAFCRIVDDSVDEAPNREEAGKQICFWRGELHEIYGGHPTHPVSQALQPVVQAFAIPKIYLQEIVSGCEMDLVRGTYETFSDLEDYCFRVASCVGLVSLPIFGVAVTPHTKHGAIALGKALQLTNILRDIPSDLKRGRVYLPQEELKKFGVTREALEKGDDNLDLLDLLYFEIGRARGCFKEAWELFSSVPTVERKKMLAAVLMGRFYEAILDKISHDPLAVFRGKVALSAGEKLKIAGVEIFKSILS